MNTGPTNEPYCQLLLALCRCNKPTLGKNTVCKGTTCVRTLTLGDTPEVSEKRACQHEVLLADGKTRLMVSLKLDRKEKFVELQR